MDYLFIYLLGSSNSSSSFKEDDVIELTKLGFNREQVIIIKYNK